MARYDDGKRGFAVTDALGLNEAWHQIQMKCLGDAPHSQLQIAEAERNVIRAIKSGELPLWIAPVDRPLAERQLAASSLIEFGRASLIAGCYRPYNDTENLAYGYPLFVKRDDWAKLHSELEAEPQLSKLGNSIASAEHQCKDWLRNEFKNDPQKRRAKADFRKAALAKFPGRLSIRGFDLRVWPALAQQDGRDTPGAKKKS